MGTPRLTQHEVSVLSLIVAGRSLHQIATTLDITLHTVEASIQLLLEKLGANDIEQAVAIALRDGLLTPESRHRT
jgi:DNA-binding NarL/FixJ family response regulator